MDKFSLALDGRPLTHTLSLLSMIYSSTEIEAGLLKQRSSLEGMNLPYDVSRKRATEVWQPYTLCGTTGLRPKGLQGSSNEGPLNIFRDCQCADRPINAETRMSQCLLQGPSSNFVDISIERVDSITVDKQDETLVHGTKVGLHQRIEKKYKSSDSFTLGKSLKLLFDALRRF
ncbi:uncharacterized protein LOC135146010 isoform X2 [Zophobas morio]|uniref:uncharacterized protein LOC135146010 isoform X2 n=1 Tax=Zophobas morio TaxID=2755281 RepID=UPI003083E10E